MNFLHFFLLFLIIILQSTSISNAQNSKLNDVNERTIKVDQSGNGNFVKVQDAINSIPSGNTKWMTIYIKAGIYNEKVYIPRDKPFIILKGESMLKTIIQWGDYGESLNSTTFMVWAPNFVASHITFKNTHDKLLPYKDGKKITWAPAFYVGGDKSSFYNCAFISLQDTLTDFHGRHYFKLCFIEGAIDFIWGYGQSIYEDCVINVETKELSSFEDKSSSYITAQGRGSIEETSGFVFIKCNIQGTGPAYLGRAYGKYSRVIFMRSFFSDIIAPEGWSQWNYHGSDGFITYSEVRCSGPGSQMSKRVKWEKTLPRQELNKLINIDVFINQDGWIQKQPCCNL